MGANNFELLTTLYSYRILVTNVHVHDKLFSAHSVSVKVVVCLGNNNKFALNANFSQSHASVNLFYNELFNGSHEIIWNILVKMKLMLYTCITECT